MPAQATPISPDQPSVPPARKVGSLAQKATRGFAWLMFQTVGSKGVSFVSEVFLARWIAKPLFGVRADAMIVFAFITLLQDYGINQVLIHRQRTFHRWANSAFWASIAIGLLGAAIFFPLAPVLAKAFARPELKYLIYLLAIRSPISAIGTVSYAKLQADLRYRTLALITFLTALVTAVSAVIFAWKGFGVYSFIVPLVVAAVARSGMLWLADPPRVRLDLQLHRWRYLTMQSGSLIAASALFTLTSQGDYIILGAKYGRTDAGMAAVVSIYFFGFWLCVQTTQFITTSLANVLLPTFSKLQEEPARLKAAFLRATEMLAVFGVFVCLLQAAVAAPMIQTLFRPKDDPMKWVPAVPVLQIISVGMALQIFNMPAQSLIQAQGRFATLLKFAIFCPILFFALIWSASLCGVGGAGEIRVAWMGHLLDAAFRQHVNVASVVACAVVVYCLITGPMCLWIAIRPLGGTWREIWPIYFWPVLSSGVAIFVGMLAGQPLPHSPAGNWAKLLLVPTVSGVCYVPLVRWTAPRAWADVISRLNRRK